MAAVVAGEVQGTTIGILVVVLLLLVLLVVVVEVVQVVVRIVVVVSRMGLHGQQLTLGLLVGQGQCRTQGGSAAVAGGAHTGIVVIAVGCIRLQWRRRTRQTADISILHYVDGCLAGTGRCGFQQVALQGIVIILGTSGVPT